MERMRACLAGSVLISGKGSSMSFAHDGLLKLSELGI
jgi:hypothetical protein